MRFAIKQSGCGNERVGALYGFIKSPNAKFETPTSALFTKGGNVAHLTADVLAKVFSEPQLLWVPLSNCLQLETGAKAQGEGLAKFASVTDHVTCITVNDLSETTPTGHFEGDTVPLWTRHGKKKFTGGRYMEVMDIFKPDMFLTLADSRTSLNEAHKRIIKSVSRTSNLLQTCITHHKDSNDLKDSALIGVVVGASRALESDACIQNVLAHIDQLSGIALSGLTDGDDESIKATTVEQLEPIFKRIGESIPKHLLRIVEGSWNPAVVVAAIEHGWDVFDGTYPYKLTNSGQALALSLHGVDKEELCILDFNDDRYKEEFKPILEGCTCLACRKHTRAYIHHLINTREMLAQVLLNIHNMHHFDEMFRVARQHITSNTFQQFKTTITKQYELYRAAQIEKDDDVKKNSFSEEVASNKKKRIL